MRTEARERPHSWPTPTNARAARRPPRPRRGAALVQAAGSTLAASLVVIGCAPTGEAASDADAGADAASPAGELAPAPATDRYLDDDGRVRVALIKMPYSGARNVPERSGGPDELEAGGLHDLLASLDVVTTPAQSVALTPDQEDDYGEWHRMGMANGHLGDLVAAAEREGRLTVALESNCTSVLGVLGGLQRAGDEGPLRIGLVFIDAHGDFNTPETTLSGMLGGMPVAVAAGMCLNNLRDESRLEDPIPTERIVMGAVRDLDPLERELVEVSDIEHITVDDMRSLSDNLHAQMRRLSATSDRIYVHIDMDVLDPREVAGHPLTVPDGPTSAELAAVMTEMFRYPKAAALGIASTPWGPRDPDGLSRQAAYNLIEGAIRGVQSR